jgi:hypothetical protein
MEIEPRKVPETVSIVALGQSKQLFIHETIRTGNPRGVADEVWTINKLGPCLKHDLLFRMDDLREFYEINRHSYINQRGEKVGVHDSFMDFMKNHDKPIVTSRAYPEFPTSVEYPLEDVVNTIGVDYIRTTPAYALAFAIHIGVKKVRIYGCDYNYPNDKYTAEAGRANLEFLIAVAIYRGIDVWIAHTSTLMDKNMISNKNFNPFYGYKDHVNCEIDEETSKFKISFDPEKTEKVKKKRADVEKAHLQTLIDKYRDEVKHDLIAGKWITKEDIDAQEDERLSILKTKQESDSMPVKNIDLPGFPMKNPDAPHGKIHTMQAVTEPLKENTDDNPAKIYERCN